MKTLFIILLSLSIQVNAQCLKKTSNLYLKELLHEENKSQVLISIPIVLSTFLIVLSQDTPRQKNIVAGCGLVAYTTINISFRIKKKKIKKSFSFNI